MTESESSYTYTAGGNSTGIWFGIPDEPEFIEHCCFDLYDYEDYVGLAHQILAMEWGWA
jgi:hypothetical protein